MSALAIIGVNGDVGDEVDALFVVFEWDQAGVADDFSVFLPYIPAQRQGCGFDGTVGPFDKGVVVSGAAHVLHVAAAFTIHRAGETGLDQVSHGGKVA